MMWSFFRQLIMVCVLPAAIYALIGGSSLYGIGHYYSTDPALNDRYYSPADPYINPPADLLAPTDHLMTSLGSFISRHVVLGVIHLQGPNPSTSVPVMVPNSLIPGIGGAGYTSVDFPIVHVDDAGDYSTYANLDVRLHTLADEADYNGHIIKLSEVNTNYFRVANDVRAGETVSLGGFGETFTGTPIGSPGDGGTLRWGRNVVASASAFFDPNTGGDTHLNFDIPGQDNHAKYEGMVLSGDSGSGVYARDGWEWTISAVNRTADLTSFTSSNALSIRQNRNWIRDTVLSRDSVDLFLPQASLPKPLATIKWTPPTGTGNWNTAANWLPNGTPRRDAQRADTVGVESGAVTITTSANAQDVFVGGLESFAAINVESGAALSVDSLFVGAATGESGIIRLKGGTINAYNEYVGVRGTIGSFNQTGGVNHVVGRLVVGKEENGEDELGGNYLITGATTDNGNTPSLVAGQLIVGEQANSIGQVRVVVGDYASVTTGETVVGARGTGTMILAKGVHTISQKLSIGEQSGGNGSYLLSGTGAIVAKQADLIVGEGGYGTLSQSGQSSIQAKNLVIASGANSSGSYTLTEGTLTAFSGVSVGAGGNGSIVQDGGLLTTELVTIGANGSYTMNGGTLSSHKIVGQVTFTGTSGVVSANGITDVSQANFVNSTTDQLVPSAESLVIVDSPASAAKWKASPSGTLSPHVVGNTLNVSNASFKGYGQIQDRVVVSDSGAFTVEKPPADFIADPKLQLNGGLVLNDDGNITVPATTELHVIQGILVDHGQPKISGRGTIDAYLGQVSDGITIQPGATLAFDFEQSKVINLRGGANVQVNGTLKLGPESSTKTKLFVVADDAAPGTHSVTFGSGSSLRMKVLSDSDNDQLALVSNEISPGQNASVDATLAGNLSLTLPNSYIPAPEKIFTIIQAQGPAPGHITGKFDSITLTGKDVHRIYVNDVSNNNLDSIAMAVLYPGTIYTGIDGLQHTVGNEVVVRATLPGDLNLDNVVNGGDTGPFLAGFAAGYGTWVNGDMNGDGLVDPFDTALFLVAIAQGRSWTGLSPGPVPEPATAVLAIPAIVGLFGVIRRRR